MTEPKKSKPKADRVLDPIRDACRELRLPALLAAIEAEVEAGPRPDDTRLDFLWRVLEPQLRARRERSIARRLREARFPCVKTLDDFDFAFQPGLDRELVMELATIDFVGRGQNVLFAGMSGTGKSHIAISLGHLACARGYRARYSTAGDMLETLFASLASQDLPRAERPFVLTDLLVIDEVGLYRPERDTTRHPHLFYKVIATRYRAHRSTIITSNIDWEDWGNYLGDHVASVAILDRLAHRGHSITIEGPSWRAAQHELLNRRKKKARPEPEKAPPAAASKSRPKTTARRRRK